MFEEVGPGAPPADQRDLTAEEYSVAAWRVAKAVLRDANGDNPPELQHDSMPEGWGPQSLPGRDWIDEHCSDVLPSKYCKVDPDLRRQAAEVRARVQASRASTLRPTPATTPGQPGRSRARSAEDMGLPTPPPARPFDVPAVRVRLVACRRDPPLQQDPRAAFGALAPELTQAPLSPRRIVLALLLGEGATSPQVVLLRRPKAWV